MWPRMASGIALPAFAQDTQTGTSAPSSAFTGADLFNNAGVFNTQGTTDFGAGSTTESGRVAQRLDDMAERILWALFAKGAVDNPIKATPIDYAAHAVVSQKAAEESLVLLKNDGDLLPLRGVKSIAIIGGIGGSIAAAALAS